MADEEHGQDGQSTTAALPPTTRREEMLREFLRDHEADCPVCGYNLRGLTTAVCPECQQALTLTVGASRLRLAWLFIALVPGFFSGVAACFVMVMTVAIFIEDGTLVLPLAGAVVFGWCSGLFAIFLAVRRKRMITRPVARQRWLAIIVWLVHIAAFVLLVLFLEAYV